MNQMISLDGAINVIKILENVVRGEETRTIWECQTEYDQRGLSVYRSALLDAAGYLSNFYHWTLPVPTMQPATHLHDGSADSQPDTIDTIQKKLMEDVIVQDGWTYIILATHLQDAGLLKYTNVGFKFHKFFDDDRKRAV